MERDRSDDGIAFTGRAPRVPFPGQDVAPGRAVLALPLARSAAALLGAGTLAEAMALSDA